MPQEDRSEWIEIHRGESDSIDTKTIQQWTPEHLAFVSSCMAAWVANTGPKPAIDGLASIDLRLGTWAAAALLDYVASLFPRERAALMRSFADRVRLCIQGQISADKMREGVDLAAEELEATFVIACTSKEDHVYGKMALSIAAGKLAFMLQQQSRRGHREEVDLASEAIAYSILPGLEAIAQQRSRASSGAIKNASAVGATLLGAAAGALVYRSVIKLNPRA